VNSTPERAPESREREAAFRREQTAGARGPAACDPDIANLERGELYELVAENVRDYAIFLMDPSGVIKCWGEGARLMKGWSREQAEGAHLRLLYPDGGAEDGTAESHIEVAARTGEYTGEGHRVRNDGSTFWAYVTLTALRNSKGELVGFTKVTRDFTARRAVEAELTRQGGARTSSQEAIDDATRLHGALMHLSHELRTPLNAIVGSIAMLQRNALPEQQAHVDRLNRNGRHMLALVEGALQWSRIDAGQMPYTPSARRLGAAVEEALDDIVPQLPTQGPTLVNSVSGAAGDLPYWGDQDRVRQVLINLLTNALKFTPPDGRVTISGGTADRIPAATLAGAGPWAYLRVEDTGRGIAPEDLTRIFEPFAQAEAGDQRRGTGLGLPISRQLARHMGGDVTVDSAVGVGSTFTLWLPIAPSNPVPR
jgi:PAS domain S-box-containing protein